MNLLKNPNWKSLAEEKFKFNIGIDNGKKMIHVDYVILNEKNRMIYFGYDLPELDFDSKNIFWFLMDEHKQQGEASLLHKINSFGVTIGNPFVFLVSKNLIYYKPSGVNQAKEMYWENTDNLGLLLTKNTWRDNEIYDQESES